MQEQYIAVTVGVIQNLLRAQPVAGVYRSTASDARTITAETRVG
jgi:hypothetical protein